MPSFTESESVLVHLSFVGDTRQVSRTVMLLHVCKLRKNLDYKCISLQFTLSFLWKACRNCFTFSFTGGHLLDNVYEMLNFNAS